MKPYGRERNLKGRPYKIDRHVKKYGCINWWETQDNIIPRSTMKQNIIKDIHETQLLKGIGGLTIYIDNVIIIEHNTKALDLAKLLTNSTPRFNA